jgi:uncharacterized protein
MAVAKSPQEPSMEEIIASINRLIAEEGGTREPVLPPVAEKDDILDLTEAVDEDGKVRRIEPAGPAAAPPEGLAPAASATAATPPGPAVATPAGEPAREPVGESGEKPGKDAEAGSDRMLSAATSAAAAAAFARLGALPRGDATAAELPVGNAAHTLEDIVRDALRPLLRSWLDAHLPAIVERLVREEIARVAGKAGLR